MTIDTPTRARKVGRRASARSRAVTVLLAERHSSTRLRLRRALEHHGFSVVAEAADADGAVLGALEQRPSLCVLDVSMPGGGIVAARQIVSDLPTTKVAMLGTSLEGDELLEAIRAGADGYLLKFTEPDRLTQALRALLRGEVALPRALTTRLVTEFRVSQADEPYVDSVEIDAPATRSRLRYVPRFLHHYRRRRRSGMSVSSSFASAQIRMRDYR